MTIKVDRVPASEHLLILLDKNNGKKETGMVDPKNLGKTETIGTIVNKGFKVPAEYEIGEKVYLPLNQQQHLFECGGNSFCMIHYSYITVFMSGEYTVDLETRLKFQSPKMSAAEVLSQQSFLNDIIAQANRVKRP